MNIVVLIGRWTKELELSFTPGNGTAVAKGTLAVDRRFSKDGQKEADFIPVVIWGKQAESTANYCGAKGNLIAIEGRIQVRNYDAKDGTKRYVTEVVAEKVKFLNSKTSSGNNHGNGNGDSNFGGSNSSQGFGSGQGFNDDIYGEDITPIEDGDIPF